MIGHSFLLRGPAGLLFLKCWNRRCDDFVRPKSHGDAFSFRNPVQENDGPLGLLSEKFVSQWQLFFKLKLNLHIIFHLDWTKTNQQLNFLFLKWLVIFRQPAVAISSQRFVQSFFTRFFLTFYLLLNILLKFKNMILLRGCL